MTEKRSLSDAFLVLLSPFYILGVFMGIIIKVKTGSISKYGTFGIHEEWIDEFLANPEGFWEINALGKKQVDSFKAWLKDAEFIDAKNKLTELGQFCSDNYSNERELIWEIIWINLCHNSTLTNWFVNTINSGQPFDKKLLNEYASDRFAGEFTPKTISYAITGFLQLFKYSPIGMELLQGEPDIDGLYKRSAYDNLSEAGFAYSLYKYSQAKGIKSLRVNDFYQEDCDGGPVKEFCIDKADMEKLLRTLNSAGNRILIAELNMGLDNISLTKEISPLDVVKSMV